MPSLLVFIGQKPIFFVFFLGGRAIHYTHMYVQRKKPQVLSGRPLSTKAASYPHYLGGGRHRCLQRGSMSSKTSSLQGSCSPTYSRACSFSTNKASPLSESTQHGCQQRKYNEVSSKVSSKQDRCQPSRCQACLFSMAKRLADAQINLTQHGMALQIWLQKSAGRLPAYRSPRGPQDV